MRTRRDSCRATIIRRISSLPILYFVGHLCVAACLLALLVPSRDALAAADDRVATYYNIATGDLDDALKQFADQANVQLLYAPSLVRGKRSVGLSGHYNREAVLALLLREHGLTALAINPNTFSLQAVRMLGKKHPERPNKALPAPPQTHQDALPIELSAVTVTGTRIARTSLETSTPVTVITADEIERSGYGTLFELLRVQPGMFGHHPVAVSSEGGKSFQPIVTASSTSLYALGPRATLFLVDGRRVADFGLVSAELGGLFDLNGIPLSFIDRIEILRGGASAIYGADAIAGTVNIILKKSPDINDSTVSLGVSERGDAPMLGIAVNFGNHTKTGGALSLGVDFLRRNELAGDRRQWHTANLSRYGLADGRDQIGRITGQDLTIPPPQCTAKGLQVEETPYRCLFDPARYRTLQPEIDRRSARAYWSQPIGDSTLLYASGRYVNTEQSLQAPPQSGYVMLSNTHSDGDPLQTSAPLHYAFVDIGPTRNRTVSHSEDIAIGIDSSVNAWNWGVSLSHNRDQVTSRIDNVILQSKFAQNAGRYRFQGVQNPESVAQSLADTISSHGYHRIQVLEATVDGPLFEAPGGQAYIASGIEVSREHMVTKPDDAQIDDDLSLGATTVARNLRTHAAAWFVEAKLPLQNWLNFNIANRIDYHKRYGTQTSPKIGVEWKPDASLLVRMSAGKGYRVPSLQDQRAPIFYTQYMRMIPVPAEAPFTPCQEYSGYCFVAYGASNNLNLRPEYSDNSTIGVVWAPNNHFSISLDRYRVIRKNEFEIVDPITAPQLSSDGLVRDGSQILKSINVHLANVAKSDSRGWELETNYALRARSYGDFSFRLNAHYLEKHLWTTAINKQTVDLAGHDMPRLTIRSSLQWRHSDWDITLTARHFGQSSPYAAAETCPVVNHEAGKCRNPAATLFDLNIGYSGSNRWSFSLWINNLADRQPVNYRAGRDGYNMAIDDIYGRYYAASATYRF